MKQKLAVAILSMTLLSGCYTYVCPTYTVKPKKSEHFKVEKPADVEENKAERAS
jgi:PBP1b-binding outer membrane lipoprotein LpoB